MQVLKEDGVFLVLGDHGDISSAAEGVYRDDTRLLSRWSWACTDLKILSVQPINDTLHQYGALVGVNRSQVVGLSRTLVATSAGFSDTWSLENTSAETRVVTLQLDVEGEFRDLFSVWSETSADGDRTVTRDVTSSGAVLSRQTSDGRRLSASIVLQPVTGDVVVDGLLITATLSPGARASLVASVTFDSTERRPLATPLPDYLSWRNSFDLHSEQSDHQKVIERAIDDLRMLLLGTEHGPYPAAGLPWFSCIFGRDAIITAQMLLPWRSDIARSVLLLLAANQGQRHDPFREEEPGKILHEVRLGELSRLNRVPFGRYYGSVDATPLYVGLLDAYVAATGDQDLLIALRPAWEGAVQWLMTKNADASDLISFEPSGSGLAVQSWKDSADSMNHEDGAPAEPPLSVAEVQGYAFAAFEAAARFYSLLGEPASADTCRSRAQRLAADVQRRFWLDDLDLYAMALDRHGAPLRVAASDSGHLLWSGIVPSDQAPRLVARLMEPDLWTGWGVRTLGDGARRFNPVSYHNGSVWPHDTALMAGGLARYGFREEARTVALALFDLAATQPLHRMPELISGFARQPRLDPVAYVHACKPQAWSAAGLLYAARAAGLA